MIVQKKSPSYKMKRQFNDFDFKIQLKHGHQF